MSNLNLTGSLNNLVPLTTSVTGSYLALASNSYSSFDISVNNDITDFMELTLMALGYDITFEDFKKMSKEERKSIMRDIKINRIIG